MLGIVLLAISAALLAVAIVQRVEGSLMAAVVAYAGTAIYLVGTARWLLPAALAVALLMGVFAVIRFLSGQPRRIDAAFFLDGN